MLRRNEMNLSLLHNFLAAQTAQREEAQQGGGCRSPTGFQKQSVLEAKQGEPAPWGGPLETTPGELSSGWVSETSPMTRIPHGTLAPEEAVLGPSFQAENGPFPP